MKLVFILAAILIFGLLIAVHEFGHFITAKLCGVRVNEFAIGMGPLIFQKEKGETLYSLRALPIGGFCAMEGEDEDTGDERSFVRQGFLKKFLILVAGSFMNFVAGVCILLVLHSNAVGFNVDAIAGVAPEFSRTGENGLEAGDLVYKVDGYRTFVYGDSRLFLTYADESVDIEVVRDGRHILLEDVTRQTYTAMDGSTYTGFGIYLGVTTIPADLGAKLKFTCYAAADYVQMVWFSLAALFNGGATVEDLSGPVGIVSTITEVGASADTTREAWSRVFYFAALLAVNLAVMNLLPIPALDGGRIFFLAIDAIALLFFKRKVPEKYQAVINTAGFVLLMGFMLLITFKDVFQILR